MLQQNIATAEYDATLEIMTNADRIENFADAYALLLDIYSLMVNEKDKAVVLAYIRLYHKRIDALFKVAMGSINRRLPALRTPALLSQSERVRDNIRQIEEKIRSWVP